MTLNTKDYRVINGKDNINLYHEYKNDSRLAIVGGKNKYIFDSSLYVYQLVDDKKVQKGKINFISETSFAFVSQDKILLEHSYKHYAPWTCLELFEMDVAYFLNKTDNTL